MALVYKEMKLKPTVFNENKNLLSEEFKKSLVSDDDIVYLED